MQKINSNTSQTNIEQNAAAKAHSLSTATGQSQGGDTSSAPTMSTTTSSV